MFIIKKKENNIYLKFVNKYIVLDEITDYNCFGKPIKITNKEFDYIFINLTKNIIYVTLRLGDVI